MGHTQYENINPATTTIPVSLVVRGFVLYTIREGPPFAKMRAKTRGSA
jgi:hypothetical protein